MIGRAHLANPHYTYQLAQTLAWIVLTDIARTLRSLAEVTAVQASWLQRSK